EINPQALPVIAGRQRAEEAVGVTDAKRCDARGPLQRLRGAVADRFTGSGFAHLKNACCEMDHRRKRIIVSPARFAAVKRDAGTDEVIVIGSPQENAGGVGETCGRLRKFAAHGLEVFALRLVLVVVWLVGTSKMTHQERKLERSQKVFRSRDRGDLGRGKAE